MQKHTSCSFFGSQKIRWDFCDYKVILVLSPRKTVFTILRIGTFYKVAMQRDYEELASQIMTIVELLVQKTKVTEIDLITS
jgi:hypothetical protein